MGVSELTAVHTNLLPPLYTHDNMEDMLKNSYKNFHARGLSYLCLHRSQMITTKAYFYDGTPEALAGMPDLICPHDHRYDFRTTVLAGECVHKRYTVYRNGEWQQSHMEYEWKSPLLGGNGHTRLGLVSVKQHEEKTFRPGQSYDCRAEEIHTIAVTPGTILLLAQFADVYAPHIGTSTFVPRVGDTSSVPLYSPSLNELYQPMSAPEARVLLGRLGEAIRNLPPP